MSTCWINRPRPAPIDRRSAISRSRAAVRARNRFATFEPAMSRTSAAIEARIHSGRSNWRRSGDGPLAAEPHVERRAEEARDALGRPLRPEQLRRESRRKFVNAACSTLCACSIRTFSLQASDDAEPAEAKLPNARGLYIAYGNHTSVGRPGSTPGEARLGHADDLELVDPPA